MSRNLCKKHLLKKVSTLNYLSRFKEKSIFLGFNFYTYYSLERKILASYARDLGELYLASEDDHFLREFESEIGMEFD